MIKTWQELVESGITLDYRSIDEFVGREGGQTVAIVKHDDDELLRLPFGAVLYSIPHQNKHEMVIVVQEGPLVIVDGYTPYLDTSKCMRPHTRTALSLGLLPQHDHSRAPAVLVPLDKLKQIEFTPLWRP